MGFANKVAVEFPYIIKVFNDGSIERIADSIYPYVPPSLHREAETGVSSKDITISENPKISARLYLPKMTDSTEKLPVLVYFHGGAFCVTSAFSSLYHHYMNILVSEARVVAVSVEYRLAPEVPLPAAYEDCWVALNWAVSTQSEPWILNHGDLNRLYIGGDSAGANIAHNIAMRAGEENLPGNAKILGAILSQIYFWASKPIKNESEKPGVLAHMMKPMWDFVYPDAPGGIDNPKINPAVPGAPSLAGLGCSKILICVAEKDTLRDRGEWYCELIKASGWKGEVEIFETEGEDHGFYLFNLHSDRARKLVKRQASFIR